VMLLSEERYKEGTYCRQETRTVSLRCQDKMTSLLNNALLTLGITNPTPTTTSEPKQWPLNTDKLRTSLKEAGFNRKIVARCDIPPVYEAAIFRWSENFEGLPALVVYPESEEDVSVVVRFIMSASPSAMLSDTVNHRSSSPPPTE
jgi:hypothetical protein